VISVSPTSQPAAASDQAPETPQARRWAAALGSWGIPQPIVDAAPRDPWGMPVARFAGRADRAISDPGGVSYERAAAALSEEPGSVLDVGAGAGAGSLPLAGLASALTAVDDNEEMLVAFSERATSTGTPFSVVRGSWPTVASQVAPHDLVLAHHVVYNVPAIGSFVTALTDHARRTVVVELTPRHPMSWMTPLWERFHDISRPVSPTVDDLVAVLEEVGVHDLTVDRWQRYDPSAADGSDSEQLSDRAALVTQRLCLPADRESEVAEALVEMDNGYLREVVTITWSGTASR
jgi:Methyltransferase domain